MNSEPLQPDENLPDPDLLAHRILDGQMSDEEKAAAIRALAQDRGRCTRFTRQMLIHSMLVREGTRLTPAEFVESLDRQLPNDNFDGCNAAEIGAMFQATDGARSLVAKDLAPTPLDVSSEGAPGADHVSPPTLSFIGDILSGGSSALRIPGLILFGLLAMAVGGGLGAWLTASRPELGAERHVARNGDHISGAMATPIAQLVSLTNCRWDSADPAALAADVNKIRPGQTLRLLEGIAEIVSGRPDGSRGRFVLEGPLAMVVTGESGLVLQYGKLLAAVDPHDETFSLGTPLGQVSLASSASIGVVAVNQNVTIHVFAGEASFEPYWIEDELNDQDRFRVSAGSSLRLATTIDGILEIDRGLANERCFTGSISMAANRLNLTEDYVRTVRRAEPIAYWRFESFEGGFVRNEVQNKWHCRVRGTVSSRDYLGNRSAEFGAGDSSGYVFCEESLGTALGESYSIEAWVKPSHVHAAAILSLASWRTETPSVLRHGVMLGLTGPAGPWSNVKSGSGVPAKPPAKYLLNPERIRFVHRNPVGIAGGTDCYAEAAYPIREWQHLACVKDGASVRMYVNGREVASAEDASRCPEELRVLIGQIYPSGSDGTPVYRQFVGELDEIAIYDRALSADEIKKRVQLVEDAKQSHIE